MNQRQMKMNRWYTNYRYADPEITHGEAAGGGTGERDRGAGSGAGEREGSHVARGRTRDATPSDRDSGGDPIAASGHGSARDP